MFAVLILSSVFTEEIFDGKMLSNHRNKVKKKTVQHMVQHIP
jgi:hypothetical protein